MYDAQIRIMSIMLKNQITENPKLAKKIGIRATTIEQKNENKKKSTSNYL